MVHPRYLPFSWVFVLIQLLPCGIALNTLGRLDTPDLPQFLRGDGTPLPGGTPWGTKISGDSPPSTGMIRKYEWNITRGSGSPDGYSRSLLMVNGAYPGPLVEANWGDIIQVTVHNSISDPAEGTAIHWHGQTQRSTPWMDGVPSVSQCPIAPGSSFTYSFQAEEYGTSWYHSHFSAQRMDGLFGPMIVYGPSHVPYDVDVGPIIVSDYAHEPYFELLQDAFSIPPVFPAIGNNLINGRNPFNCSLHNASGTCDSNTSHSVFRFTSGKVHRLRFINTGSVDNQKISIDGHEMTVISNDYVDVVPYTTNVVTIGVGQRTDVLVNATGCSTDAIWLRADQDTNEICGNVSSIQSQAKAIVYYQDAEIATIPTSNAINWTSNGCLNDPLIQTVPFYKKTPPSVPETTTTFDVTLQLNATGHLLFYVNNSTFKADYNNPLLLLASLGNTSYPDSPEWNVYDYNQNSSVRVTFRNHWNSPHPLHLHGHNFWVLAEGIGEWDGTIVNPDNPQRRDTHIMGPGTPESPSYLVLQWLTDNPGIWPLHCHVAIHISAGLYVNVMEQPSNITQFDIPGIMAQTCRDWAEWTGDHVVDQIDSGL